jgi:hypothetical protein
LHICIKSAYYAHNYSSKTVKNEGSCQKLAKNGLIQMENEGIKKKIFKILKKYSKRG